MNKQAILFVLLLSCTSLLVAQEEPALTLQDCIQIALKNNSQLRNAQRNVEVSGTYVTAAYANLLPRISSSFGTGKYIEGASISQQVTVKTDPVTNLPLVDPITGSLIYEQRSVQQDRTERNYYSARVSLSQNVFDFGQSINGIKQIKALEASQEFTLTNTRQAVILNVKQAYYELLKSYRLQEVYQEAVQVSQDQVNRAQAMYDIGLATQAEIYQAKVNMGTNQTNLITQKNLVEINKANLNNALGRNPGIPVKVIEDKSEPIFPEYQFEQALNTAISNNQEIKSLELQAKAALYSARAARGKYLPTIAASVSYSRDNNEYNRVFSSNLDRDFSASLGISLDLNIFNGFSDRAAAQREELNYQVAQEDLAERKRTVTAEVQQYFLQLNAYKEIIDINRINLDAAKENLRLQLEKRRVESGTELEVAQAQVELTRAQSTLVQAEYEAKIAKASLEKVMGVIQE
jgi:outer membrane protein